MRFLCSMHRIEGNPEIGRRAVRIYIFLFLGSPEWGEDLEGLGVGIRLVSNGILRNGKERGEMDLSGSFRENMRLIIKFLVNFRISWNVKNSLTEKLSASAQELCSMEL